MAFGEKIQTEVSFWYHRWQRITEYLRHMHTQLQSRELVYSQNIYLMTMQDGISV